jgi:ferredoxin-NADP reductase
MKASTQTVRAQVSTLRDLTPTVREITLRLPVGTAPMAWQPGAHLQVQVSVRGQTVQRHYSLIPCAEPSCLRIAVKRAEPGRGGSQAMWRLQVGDSFAISEPLNHFPLDLQASAYLLIAGGIGITPLMSMAQTLSQRGADVRMIYTVRSASEWAYQTELKALLGDRVQFVQGADWDIHAAIASLPAKAQAYVCGPSGMLNAVLQAWASAGRAQALLRFETFGSATSQDAPFEVCLPRHELRFEVPPEASLLDALELQGVQAMWGCRRGECGLCALPVISLQGEIEHRDIFFSEHEKQSNAQICVCVSRVRGSITLDTAFRPDAFGSAASRTEQAVFTP